MIDAQPIQSAAGVPLPASPAVPAPAVLARNVAIARDLAGLTQHELAARSGLSRATIAQVEAGDGDPRLSTLLDLAAALGLSPIVLLAGPREVGAVVGLCGDLAERPVSVGTRDLARMRAHAANGTTRELSRAARIGAAAGWAAGCTSPGAAATAGLFSAVVPGRGTAIGAALGRLLG